jgi:two-component system response regulator FixJ
MTAAPTVFVVDDDPVVLNSEVALLTAQGYQTRCFLSAEQFLAEFDPETPGCLITDLRLKGMSGLELQRQLQERGASIPIVVVTGYADVPVTVRLMEQGAVTLLEKPYEPAQLVDAVERALRRDRDTRERLRRRRDLDQRLALLSEEERQVMECMLAGKPNKTISQQLSMSMRTVDRRRRGVLDKMKVSSVPELARLLAQHMANSGASS